MSSKKLKIAVVGAGQWGPNLIRNFHDHPSSEVSYIVDADPVRLEALREKYAGVRVTQKWQDAVADPTVEAVVISTPTATHFSIASEALNRGKHVFVEKPLTTNASEARLLVSLAQGSGLKLMVGHVFLFNPAVRYVKQIVESGELGEILYVYSIRTNLGPIRGDVNALWDLAPHDISILLHLFGNQIETVTGVGASYINPPVEDVIFSTLRFRGGIVANLHVSWLDPKKVRQLVIVGSRKMLLFDDLNLKEMVKIFDKNISQDLSKTIINDTIHLFRKSIVEGQAVIPELGPSEPLKNECAAFVEWVLKDTPQPSTGLLGCHVVGVLDAITQSVRKGGFPVSLATAQREVSDSSFVPQPPA